MGGIKRAAFSFLENVARTLLGWVLAHGARAAIQPRGGTRPTLPPVAGEGEGVTTRGVHRRNPKEKTAPDTETGLLLVVRLSLPRVSWQHSVEYRDSRDMMDAYSDPPMSQLGIGMALLQEINPLTWAN